MLRLAHWRFAVLVLSMAAVACSSHAANIIWVSEARSPALASAYSTAAGQGWNIQNPADATPYDQGWIDLLAADGHTIDYRANATTGDPIADWQSNGYWQGTLSQTQKDELNAADLIIVSPDFNGTQYNPGDTGRLDWNAIETPLLSLTPQTMTTDVWHWTEKSSADLFDFNLLVNNSTGRAGRTDGLPNGGANTQPPLQRVLSQCCQTFGRRSSNDSVQWDVLDETSGSQQLQYMAIGAPELVYNNNDTGTLDFTRPFATAGDSYVDDTFWLSEQGESFVYEARWDAGQEWCPSCDPGVTPAPAGARQMFNAATVGADVDGFYEGGGQEILSTGGESLFLDGVNRMVAGSDLTQLRQNRPAPFYTPVIDGTVTAQEIQGQLKVPMTVARDGVAPEDQMRGGTVLQSSNAQNGVLDEGTDASGVTTGQMTGFDPAELSGNWYISWDNDNLYVSAVIKDNTPFFAMTRDTAFAFDAVNLPQDGVGFLFNANNDPGSVVTRYEAAVGSDQPGPNDPPALGPSVNQNSGLTSFAQLQQDGLVLEGEQTTDEQQQIDGYVLEMAVPWAVAMAGAGGDEYVPAPGDEHGLSFFLGGWNGFQGGGGADAANRRSLIIDYGYGLDESDRSPTFTGLEIFDPSIWNYITLVSADFDGDGDVDGADFLDIQRNAPGLISAWEAAYGATGQTPPATQIPEPTSLAWLAAAIVAGCLRRR